MKDIYLLNNPIQNYAWGSPTAIPELLGQPVTGEPLAELWMGAHPKAPSMAGVDGKQVPLINLIQENPVEILGSKIAAQFNNALPFLFKVLAAGRPLSIQAHPNRKQAELGFKHENALGIPVSAPNRNYRDASHKPEIICALTPFWALNGFRKMPDIIAFMDKVCPKDLFGEISLLNTGQPSSLKAFFEAIMTLDPEKQQKITGIAAENAENVSDENHAFEWMIKLHKEYPGDIGLFAPVILNLVRLEPGQAMFLPAGELHAYLDGVGIELMANSDNVLRGGLTPKHVDVPELLKVLNFEERDLDILNPVSASRCEKQYVTSAKEFALSVMMVTGKEVFTSPDNRSVEILLCTDGKAVINQIDGAKKIQFAKGSSAIIPASAPPYTIEGSATVYKAAVPV